jgi:hypothetical protein
MRHISHRANYVAVSLSVAVLTASAKLSAQQSAGQNAAGSTSADVIEGVVSSRFGAEPGVWVIAETGELGTRFVKIAVTDEQGRFVLPELPRAHYEVWMRGYGLIDSPKLPSEPGNKLTLTATVAPDLAAAAQYYPAQSTGFRC